jgi:hypothetical protein
MPQLNATVSCEISVRSSVFTCLCSRLSCSSLAAAQATARPRKSSRSSAPARTRSSPLQQHGRALPSSIRRLRMKLKSGSLHRRRLCLLGVAAAAVFPGRRVDGSQTLPPKSQPKFSLQSSPRSHYAMFRGEGSSCRMPSVRPPSAAAAVARSAADSAAAGEIELMHFQGLKDMDSAGWSTEIMVRRAARARCCAISRAFDCSARAPFP